VNRYIFNIDNGWNRRLPWPFQDDSLIVEGNSKDCLSIVYPRGNPNSNSTYV